MVLSDGGDSGCSHHQQQTNHTDYLHFYRFRYIYTNQFDLATVQFGMISLSFCIFSLGLSVGVVIAVGMLLFFQVRNHHIRNSRNK